MNTYLCSYFYADDQAKLYFRCQAENEEHAEEQLLNAEPQATSPFCEIFSSETSDD